MNAVVQVACAIIVREGKILVAQRKPEVRLGGYWEFPGGKCEPGETMEDCVAREVYEELGVQVKPRKLYGLKEVNYEGHKFLLHFYFCDWTGGDPSRRDCQDFAFIEPAEMRNYSFIPADSDIIDDLIARKDYWFGVDNHER